MPASASFLNSCNTAVRLTPEYAAFVAALAALSSAGEEQRLGVWNAAYSDAQPGLSPAYRLRRAVRATVADQQAILVVALSQEDSEAAYQTLIGSLVPDISPPVPTNERTPSLTADDIDMVRAILVQMAGD